MKINVDFSKLTDSQKNAAVEALKRYATHFDYESDMLHDYTVDEAREALQLLINHTSKSSAFHSDAQSAFYAVEAQSDKYLCTELEHEILSLCEDVREINETMSDRVQSLDFDLEQLRAIKKAIERAAQSLATIEECSAAAVVTAQASK